MVTIFMSNIYDCLELLFEYIYKQHEFSILSLLLKNIQVTR